MRIAFFVNSVEGETPAYTTTSLAIAAQARGHSVVYVTPGDFVLKPDDSLAILCVEAPTARHVEKFVEALKAASDRRRTYNAPDIDILFLRSDPSLDAADRPWAAYAGVLFGRLAAERGILVVNDPDGLAIAQNKLYLQSFPEQVRPPTLISRDLSEIRAFVKDHSQGVIIKPLHGSGGKNVFHVAKPDDSNLNQIVEATSAEGYLITQAYLTEAKSGDVRLFLMNGEPLISGGKYAALKRVPAKGDIRSNIHASGTARKVIVTDSMLSVAATVRPKLLETGMFLVGLDIVGDKLLEINVYTPGGLGRLTKMYGVNFEEAVILSLEEKLRIRSSYGRALTNARLATL
ncbi:glutathione synthetase [Mesorhizobium sp. SB112]|uniref:glutathione synthetase n=1 Tax=Mesorhizobium sp. SB112 TaxID=3151853 RepID=UPI003267E10B